MGDLSGSCVWWTNHIPYLKGVTFYGTQLFNAATTACGALVPVQFFETLSLLPENTLRIVCRTCNTVEKLTTRMKFNKEYLKHPIWSSATFFSESLKRKSVISFTYELLLYLNMRFWSHNLQLWEGEPFRFCCALLSFSFINMNCRPYLMWKKKYSPPPSEARI